MITNMLILIFCVLCGHFIEICGIMIKKECPVDEMHKSCSFNEEYICWVNDERLERVKTAPKRLPHCQSGCYCKKGYVREYPNGGCIVTAGCRDQKTRAMLNKLPMNKGLYIMTDVGRGE